MKNFDYWMLEVIELALKEYERKTCWTTRGKRIYKENKNRWNELGQVRLIQERIQEARESFDEQIKFDLANIKKTRIKHLGKIA